MKEHRVEVMAVLLTVLLMSGCTSTALNVDLTVKSTKVAFERTSTMYGYYAFVPGKKAPIRITVTGQKFLEIIKIVTQEQAVAVIAKQYPKKTGLLPTLPTEPCTYHLLIQNPGGRVYSHELQARPFSVEWVNKDRLVVRTSLGETVFDRNCRVLD